MRKHALRVACLTLLVLLARQAGAAAASLTERFEHTYPLRAGGELSLANVNGSVAIAVWDRQEVQVMAEKKVRAGKAEDAKRLLAQLRIDVAPGPGKLR